MSITELSPALIALCLAGAALAGFINTLAGNGSAITLSLLTEVLGLPPLIANGTNRVGVFAQSVTSSLQYYREGKLRWRLHLPLIATVVSGALVGAVVASQVSNAAFRAVFGYTLVFTLVLVFLKPKQWLREGEVREAWPQWGLLSGALLCGFYGGFIQMGFGPLFLALAVLGGGLTLTEANVLKVVVVTVYTVPVLAVFVWQGQVHWGYGLLLSVGQAGAAYFTSRFAVRSAYAGPVAYGVLIVVVLVAAGRQLLF